MTYGTDSEGFRNWNAVFKRLFEAVSKGADMQYVMTDGTIIKIRGHGHGTKGELRAKP